MSPTICDQENVNPMKNQPSETNKASLKRKRVSSPVTTDESSDVVFEQMISKSGNKPKKQKLEQTAGKSKRNSKDAVKTATPPLKSKGSTNPANKAASTKKSTQQSIFGFCKVQTSSESADIDKERAKECYRDAVNALKTSHIFQYKQAIAAASKLSEASLGTVESESFKFAALRNRKQGHNFEHGEEYERMLSQMSSGIFEDTSLNPAPFPDLKPAVEDLSESQLFDDCLLVSEFFQTHALFLETKLKFSASDLLKALKTELTGYNKLTGHILSSLLHALNVNGFLKKLKFFCVYISESSWDYRSASEMCKLFLLREITPLSSELKASSKLAQLFYNNEKYVHPEAYHLDPPLDSKLAKDLLSHEFHELEPQDQLTILNYLVNVLLTSPMFHDQFNDDPPAPLPIEVYAEKKAKLRQLRHQLKGEANKKKRTTINKSIREIEAALEGAKRSKKLGKLHEGLKASPIVLGFDRFHRRYLLFPESSNKGIYIQEYSQISVAEPSEHFKNDSFAVALERLVTETGIQPMPECRWYRISTLEDFEAVSRVLCKKGFRESELSKAFLKYDTEIKASLESAPEPLKFEDNGATTFDTLKTAACKVLEIANDNYLLKYKVQLDDLCEEISRAETTQGLQPAIISAFHQILPCAFPPKQGSFVNFFQLMAWFDFVEKIAPSSTSQLHAALQTFRHYMLDDKAFKNHRCPKCEKPFNDSVIPKVAACASCFRAVHLKCIDEAVDGDPSEPLWQCQKCVKGKTPEIVEDENEDAEEEEEIEEEPKIIVHNGRTLRATKQRQKRDDEGDDSSESEDDLKRRPATKDRDYREADSNDSWEASSQDSDEASGVDPEILKHFNDFCSNYRIFKALQGVVFKAFNSKEMTIVRLKAKLHMIEDMADFEDILRILEQAALKHFENNSRRLDDIKEHFDSFFRRFDAMDRSYF